MAYMQLAALFTAGALVVVGLFAAIFIDNIVKKIIGCNVGYCNGYLQEIRNFKYKSTVG